MCLDVQEFDEGFCFNFELSSEIKSESSDVSQDSLDSKSNSGDFLSLEVNGFLKTGDVGFNIEAFLLELTDFPFFFSNNFNL